MNSSDMILIGLAICGLLMHFLKKMMELRKDGKVVTFHQYYIANPDSTLFSVVATAALLLVMWHTPELTKATALAIGYVSDSVLGAFIKRSGFDVNTG